MKPKRFRWSRLIMGGPVAALAAAVVAGLASSAVAGTVIVPTSHNWAWARLAGLQSVLAPVAAPGTPYAYAVQVPLTSPTPREGRLVRVDLATGQLANGPEVLSASHLLVVGRAVALLSPTAIAPNGVPQGPYSLRMLTGRGASLGPPIRLAWAGPMGGLLSGATSLTAGGIWLPTAKGAQLVSVTSGAVLRTLNLRAGVSDVAASPDGSLVYVSLDGLAGQSSGGTVIEEIDASSGRLLAQQEVETTGWAALTPVPGAVWASYRTGMAGSANLYLARGLALVAGPSVGQFSPVPRYGSDQIQGFSVSYLGGALWLQSGSGASCSSPSTGRLRAGVVFAGNEKTGSDGWAPFATWDGLVYAVAGIFSAPSNGIVVVRPPAACGLGRVAL